MHLFKVTSIKFRLAIMTISIIAGTNTFAQKPESFDVVFDLDWTLLYKTSEPMAAQDQTDIIRYGTEVYRLAPGTTDAIIKLHNTPDVRVSFYSGGEADRNLAVVDFIYQQIALRQKNLAPYKVLNKADLVTVPDALPTERFSKRFKKDLTKISSNLNRIVLVDDIADFTPKGQEKNLLWLGVTYEDFPTYAAAADKSKLAADKDKKYFPESYSDWLQERSKITAATDIILKSLNTPDSIQKIQTYAELRRLQQKQAIVLNRCIHLFD